jgi:hypothetical protein
MVLQAVLAAVDGAPVAEGVARPRIHHQFLPDVVQLEPEALSPHDRDALRSKGHRLEPQERPFGNMQAIYWDRAAGRVEAASDPRGIGRAEVRSLERPAPVAPPTRVQSRAPAPSPRHGFATVLTTLGDENRP